MFKKLEESKSKGLQWVELRMQWAWGLEGEESRGPGAWEAMVRRVDFTTDARAVTKGL